MSERYSRLFTLESDLYAKGSPVLVSAGALLKDNMTGQILAQLKFRNITPYRIKALKVTLALRDAAGRHMDAAETYQYLDLRIPRNVEFGQKQAIFLTETTARSYDVQIDEVVFDNGAIYTGTGELLAPLHRRKPIDSILPSAELKKQYSIACGNECTYVPEQVSDLWYCTCGRINRMEEPVCHHCRRSLESLTSALEPEALKEAMNQRLLEEAAQAEALRRQAAEEAAAKKKRQKRAVILSLGITISVLTLILLFKFWFLPFRQFSTAVSMIEDGAYTEARSSLTALDDFGKSRQHIFLLNGIEYITDGSMETGIQTVLSVKIPVTVQYDTAGGTVTNPLATLNTLEDFTELEPAVKEGFRFVGWEPVTVSYQKKNGLLVELQAVWSDEFLISYELNGGSAENPATYRNNGQTILLADPVRDGYTFTGWTGTGVDSPAARYSIPAGTFGNLSFEANWEANRYVITFNANGGSIGVNQLSVTFDSPYTLPVPTREGFTFSGWYQGANQYEDGIWTQTDSLTLTAAWQPVTYQITYHLDSGNNAAGNPDSYTAESKAITLATPSKYGYKFLGWYSDSAFTDKVTGIDPSQCRDVTVYAKWELDTYTIRFAANGGTLSGAAQATFTIRDLPLTLPTVSKTGCTFLGWYDGANKHTSWNSASGVTLTAKWDPVKYSITYNLNGGQNASQNPATYHVDSGIITLQAPTRTGYRFLGWYSDSAFTHPVTQLNGRDMKNVSLYAKWEIVIYTITYHLNGGALSGSTTATFTVNNLPVTLPGATKSGLSFVSWNRDSTSGTPVDKITVCENFSLYATYIDPNLRLTLSTNGAYYTASGYSGTATHLDIPAYYKGIPVTHVSGYSYSSGTFSNRLESISLPSTIKEIGSNAFYGCSNLKSIAIPYGVTKIGNDAFANCKALTSISIPDSVTYIGDDAFDWCVNLTTIKMPKTLTYLGESAFSFCESLKSAVVPEGVESLGFGVFYGCESLESVTLPSTLKTLGGYVFDDCKSLTKIIIPKSVTSLKYSTFSGCSKINFYCRASVIPSGWDNNWNNSRPVTWGYTGN